MFGNKIRISAYIATMLVVINVLLSVKPHGRPILGDFRGTSMIKKCPPL